MEPIKTSLPGDDQRWAAIEVRDSSLAGAFVYAVRTTGVYCRPTCRSRRPNRVNVAFFDDPEAAERAGFRPCKRCRPALDQGMPGHAVQVARACRRLEAPEPVALTDLASEAGLSPRHFHRVFQQTTGVTPKEFAMTLRRTRLSNNLASGEAVAGGILGAGFGSIGRAYDESPEALGMTPGQYRQGGAGQSIQYATAATSLGRVLVAATDKGVCWIGLGDSDPALVDELAGRFPRAEVAGDDPEFAERVASVVALVDRPGPDDGLPLDIRGTAFQRLVWDALRAIPPGSTATYAEVARAIGRPSSARAVARACATNDLAVVIPCHRVVRGDGGLGGYRWGLDRKRALIDGEGTGETS